MKIACARLLVSTLAIVAPIVSAHAQSDNFAAPFLLQPMGARTVGHGEAAAADTTLGTEALWWNPAAMARMRKREFAVHHAQTFGVTTDMLAFAYPSSALGTIAASAMIVNYGQSQGADSVGNPLGTINSQFYLLSAAYASPIGKRFSAGLTAKSVFMRFVCSGCEATYRNQIGNTYAIDLGAQYKLPVSFPTTIGGSIRNLGPRLQAIDYEQADPLPRVIQVGVQSKLPIAALEKNNVALDVRGDVMSSPAFRAPSIRVGADVTYLGLYTVRAGYKYVGPNDGVEGGLTAGVGIKFNSIQFDLARRFDASSSLGESSAPTYISLRWVF